MRSRSPITILSLLLLIALLLFLLLSGIRIPGLSDLSRPQAFAGVQKQDAYKGALWVISFAIGYYFLHSYVVLDI